MAVEIHDYYQSRNLKNVRTFHMQHVSTAYQLSRTTPALEQSTLEAQILLDAGLQEISGCASEAQDIFVPLHV